VPRSCATCANGLITCAPAEKSGQDEFQFEYGDRYAEPIADFKPTFVKVLVRYNPESDETMNRRQAARLRELADHVHRIGSIHVRIAGASPTGWRATSTSLTTTCGRR
jgi:myo-inositol catabolism protein IolC